MSAYFTIAALIFAAAVIVVDLMPDPRELVSTFRGTPDDADRHERAP